MLEKMNDFFNNRINAYEEHQLNVIEGAQGIFDDEFYNYDTPLTKEHELQALEEAGFSDIKILAGWSAASTIKTIK